MENLKETWGQLCETKFEWKRFHGTKENGRLAAYSFYSIDLNHELVSISWQASNGCPFLVYWRSAAEFKPLAIQIPCMVAIDLIRFESVFL